MMKTMKKIVLLTLFGTLLFFSFSVKVRAYYPDITGIKYNSLDDIPMPSYNEFGEITLVQDATLYQSTPSIDYYYRVYQCSRPISVPIISVVSEKLNAGQELYVDYSAKTEKSYSISEFLSQETTKEILNSISLNIGLPVVGINASVETSISETLSSSIAESVTTTISAGTVIRTRYVVEYDGFYSYQFRVNSNLYIIQKCGIVYDITPGRINPNDGNSYRRNYIAYCYEGESITELNAIPYTLTRGLYKYNELDDGTYELDLSKLNPAILYI